MRGSYRSFLAVIAILLITLSCRKNKGSGVTAPPGIDPPEDTVIINPPQTPIVSYTQEARNISTTDNVNGFYVALPPRYDTATRKFPLLVFLHGGGERGTGEAALPLVLKHAVPNLIRENKFPESFTVNNQSFSFIVISPQFKEWPQPDDVKSIIDYALDNYKVDSQRVYLSGLSMGGGATWRTAAFYGRQLAAIVPICGAEWADTTEAKQIAAANVPIWAFHNRDDSVVTYNSTRRYINLINSQNPKILPRMTIWDFGGHDAWTKATDPAYREDNKNIYEWMLQFVR